MKYQKIEIDHLSKQNIYARFEYYLSLNDAYAPVKRTDTIFQLTPDAKVEDFSARNENQLPFLCFALEKMVENVNFDLYTKNLAAKKKMSVKEINEYNDKEKNIPILTGPINHGLFLTFQEFKNNK